MASRRFNMALVQVAVRSSKSETLDRVHAMVKEAAIRGAKLVCLPDGFGFHHLPLQDYHRHGESIPGYTSKVLSSMARENLVYLVGGSMLELDKGKLYKTCLVYGPDGSLLARHRKVHLYHVNIPNVVEFRESDIISCGSTLTTFNLPYCKVGVGICYDIRFPLMSNMYMQGGCKILVFPAAFGTYMGNLHWELLQKARAVDNQVYVATSSPARNEQCPYVVWGHSMIVGPKGEVVQSAQEKEDLVLGEVDLDYLESVREASPSLRENRHVPW